MTIGENIKQLRVSRKWSQQKLADEIGLSRNYISELENNKRNLSIMTLKNLAKKLGVPIGLIINEAPLLKLPSDVYELLEELSENKGDNKSDRAKKLLEKYEVVK